MPPPGYEPFLRAICENPDEDAPRLVYADWLEEQGGAANIARAEFIRVQCAQAALSSRDPSWEKANDRSRQLWNCYHLTWKAELPKRSGITWHADAGPFGSGFWRGFASGFTIHFAERFLRHADDLFAASPVQSISLARLGALQTGLALTSEYFIRVHFLSACGCEFGPNGAAAIANCAHLRELRELQLWRNNIGDAGAESLASSSHLRNLTELALLENNISDTGALKLAASPYLKGLTRIDLRRNPISPPTWETLKERFGDRLR